jgi:two-component system, LuxR family, sensor kinase FixL
MIVNLTVNQLVVFGVLHVPICATLWFLGTLTVIAYELGRELIGNGRARLQLAEVRSEWAQTERVNALGHLASALAHELGQPLTATQTNAFAARSLLKKAHPDLDELRAIVDDIETESKRASDIIHRMRTLIRRRCVELQPLDMADVVHEVLGLLRHEAASRRISLKLNLAHDLPLASGDRVHVSQVLINLLLNGMDAVRDRPPEARLVRVDARPDAGAIQIAVEDSGLGVPEDRFEEVFTSFYTTKPTGMGVGLSLSRMIVEAHSGRLWAENSASGGAIFRFTLPMAPHAAQ